ncbi:periplasmic heavy metal sensor [Aliiroseovarius subalbicans]|uniref:periplasmic heavy metal sensor n=1 Tax=Aliiroseovarius subalbicans TaxID=2925840 RepID=UPI001F598505|nr:periplasmic heavy metal sensor [Aliiroseovarius subalbicans]MCI2398605.1 periplasmic heavy metal sensor [Aliiroseovarius subalbicans]
MSDKTTAKPKGTGRLTKVILAVSLTANLLVLGLVAGAHLRDGADDRRFAPPERSAMRDMGFGPFVGALSREDRREIGKALRERGGSLAVNREALADEMKAVISALRADPFDPEALNAVLEAQSHRILTRAADGRAVLVDQVGKMDTRARARFADHLERGLRDALNRAQR